MKGIVRILEAIIASVILLTSLSFFFTGKFIPTPEDTFFIVESQDALATMEKSGYLTSYVTNNDIEGLNSLLFSSLTKNIDYSVEIVGLTPPVVFVGCIDSSGSGCTPGQLNELKSVIEGVYIYRNRTIEVRVDSESVNDIRNETTVIFIYMLDYDTNIQIYKTKLEQFLDRGGGIVLMLHEFGSANINDGILDEIFGMQYYGPPPFGIATFNNENDATKNSFKIYKYYINLTGETPSFDLESTASILVTNDTVLKSPSFTSLMLARKNVYNGHGRTVWLDTPCDLSLDCATGPVSNRTKALVLSSIFWTTGEKFTMDDFKKIPPNTYSVVRYFIAGPEPFEFRLKVWKVFY